jgi:hypothetical protein
MEDVAQGQPTRPSVRPEHYDCLIRDTSVAYAGRIRLGWRLTSTATRQACPVRENQKGAWKLDIAKHTTTVT